MGIEGAVKSGFKKELESVEDGLPRENLFADLVKKMSDRGIDEAVIFRNRCSDRSE